MKYCKNCGKENSAKICSHCGSNSRKAHNYCGWCGNEINEKVIICPNCHEKQVDGAGAKFGNAICVVLALIFAFTAAGFIFFEGAIVPAVLFLIAAVLLLPFMNNVVKNATFGNKGKRTLLSIARILAVIVIFIVGIMTIPESEPIKNEVYSNEATEAALQVFHDEVNLKNEDSFVLNDSKVTYQNSYNGNDNLALVTVVLDYSAQNGFGGMNRDTYTVKLVFNYAHGTYRPLD